MTNKASSRDKAFADLSPAETRQVFAAMSAAQDENDPFVKLFASMRARGKDVRSAMTRGARFAEILAIIKDSPELVAAILTQSEM